MAQKEHWQEYQEEAASFFRAMGCSAEVDALVEGVRGKHKIDVWVTTRRFGLEHRWVVECKSWKARVPKEKVMALTAIVSNVGADKGFLLSENGFQSGARRAARKTNIILATLEELKERAQADLEEAAALHILDEIEKTQGMVRQVGTVSETFHGAWGVDATMKAGTLEELGKLTVLAVAVKLAREGRFPIAYRADTPDGNELSLVAEDFGSLMNEAEKMLASARSWIVANSPGQSPSSGRA